MSVKLQRETNLYDTDAIQDGINIAVTNYDTNLGQARVFNKLTNNGAAQGIFMEDGQLYINMSYLQTGTLKLGGVNNTNGLMQVYDEGNNLIGTWGVDGISLLRGDINLDIDSSLKVPFNGTASDYLLLDNLGFTIAISGSTLRGTAVSSGSTTYGGLDFTKGSHSVLIIPTYIGVFATSSTGLTIEENASIQTVGGSGQWHLSRTEAWINSTRINGSLYVNSGSSVTSQIGGSLQIDQSATIVKNLVVNGTKNRKVTTNDYGERLLCCYETPSPLFGDVGEGIIADDGKCYVMIDSIFAETVSLKQYQVTLQKYGQGDCWVSERKSAYFVVEGTPGLSFGWELKAKQSDFDQYRLEKDIGNLITENSVDYGTELENHIAEIQREREVA